LFQQEYFRNALQAPKESWMTSTPFQGSAHAARSESMKKREPAPRQSMQKFSGTPLTSLLRQAGVHRA
jgi:hypothetical protein